MSRYPVIEVTTSTGKLRRYTSRASDPENVRRRAASMGGIFAEAHMPQLFHRSVYIVWPNGRRERIHAVGSARRRSKPTREPNVGELVNFREVGGRENLGIYGGPHPGPLMGRMGYGVVEPLGADLRPHGRRMASTWAVPVPKVEKARQRALRVLPAGSFRHRSGTFLREPDRAKRRRGVR